MCVCDVRQGGNERHDNAVLDDELPARQLLLPQRRAVHNATSGEAEAWLVDAAQAQTVAV